MIEAKIMTDKEVTEYKCPICGSALESKKLIDRSGGRMKMLFGKCAICSSDVELRIFFRR